MQRNDITSLGKNFFNWRNTHRHCWKDIHNWFRSESSFRVHLKTFNGGSSKRSHFDHISAEFAVLAFHWQMFSVRLFMIHSYLHIKVVILLLLNIIFKAIRNIRTRLERSHSSHDIMNRWNMAFISSSVEVFCTSHTCNAPSTCTCALQQLIQGLLLHSFTKVLPSQFPGGFVLAVHSELNDVLKLCPHFTCQCNVTSEKYLHNNHYLSLSLPLNNLSK